jgi:hypothetical protein
MLYFTSSGISLCKVGFCYLGAVTSHCRQSEFGITAIL